MEEINEYEIDGLIQTMKETGIKGLMKYTDVLVLNHMMERGWVPDINKRDELIKTLKDNSEMEYNEIMNLNKQQTPEILYGEKVNRDTLIFN